MNVAKHKAAATVDRLMAELREALDACGQGPLRATVDSDGHCIVQSLIGRPLVNGQRLVGVTSLTMRTIVGPERRPAGLVVENAA